MAFLRFRNNAIARSRATERAPRCFVGWQTSFDFGDGQVKRNKRIDTRLSWPLFMVDFLTFAGVDPASRGQ